MRQHPSQKGVALITALLVVSLATVLAVSLVDHLYYDIRRTENILRLDQAQLYNMNAVEFAMVLLKLDLQSNKFDSQDEITKFNELNALFPVEGGSISSELTDLQSCFNINNLATTGNVLAAYRKQYSRLLRALAVDSAKITTLTDSLIDWLDANDQSEPQGAEFDYYIGLQIPYRTANNLMVTPSEIRLVKGYSADIISQISRYVCVLPNINTAININTASVEMLESFPDLSGFGGRIVKDRDGNPEDPDDNAPFAKLSDFNTYAKNTLKITTAITGMQTYSEYFLLQSKTQLGAGNVKLFSMIYRDQSNSEMKVIRQTSGAF